MAYGGGEERAKRDGEEERLQRELGSETNSVFLSQMGYGATVSRLRLDSAT